MAKNSIFWHKKLRQIQAVQNLAQQPLLPFLGVQLGCPCKNPATVYSFFLDISKGDIRPKGLDGQSLIKIRGRI